MTTKQRIQLWWPRLIAAAIVITSLSLNPLAAQTVVTNLNAELPRLASKGQFDRVLELLKATSPTASQTQVASLIADLEQYQKNESDRTAERLEEYQKNLEEITKDLQENKLEEALANAITAHRLAADPDQMLQTPQVQDLVGQAQQNAETAERNDDWVEALSLHRSLDLLFDDLATHRDKVKRASQHIRVLRLYAPHQLQALYAARAQRLGNETPRKLNLDEEEGWQNKLKGINLAMLRQTLAQAARRHVSNIGYGPLMHGAIQAVIVMTQTRGLEATFPGFAHPDKSKQFHDYLVGLQASLDQRREPLNFLDAATMIDRIMTNNNKTVKLPKEVLIYELTEGCVDQLDDFSAVIWPSDKEVFSRNTQGKFSGVGIQISKRDDRLIVVSPLEETPAQRAGIKAGDIIANVDDRDTSTWSLDRAVREITGPEGSKVVLGIDRQGNSDLINFELTRAEIEIESIRGWQRKISGGWDYLIDADMGIGYIRLSQFIPQSASDMDSAINLIEQNDQLNALILDLRFNPGGLLSSSVDVSDRFIISGPIVSTVGADGKRTSQFRARADHTHRNLPILVLINEGSASASEILSGALQDYQRGVIVGTRSFGKGSVQDLFPLSNEKAYLKLTTQYYMLPRGRIIHRQPDSKSWGIEPDLEVKMTAQQMAAAMEFRQNVDILRTDEDQEQLEEPAPTADQILEKGIDPQLESALLVLKTQLIANQLTLARRATGPTQDLKAQ